MLRFVKRALDGEKIDEAFETFEVHGFKLARPVPEPTADPARRATPGHAAPGRREADGAILNWLGAERRRAVSRRSRRRQDDRRAALRRPDEPTPTLARMIGRRMISSYLTVNAYAEFHRWLGRGEALAADVGRLGQRRPQSSPTRSIPDAVVDELIIHGPVRSLSRARAALHRGRRADPHAGDRPLRRGPQRGRRGARASLDLLGLEELQHAGELLARRGLRASGMNSLGTSLGV